MRVEALIHIYLAYIHCMSLCTLPLLPSTVDLMNTPITASSDSSQRMATMMCPPPPPSLHTSSQENLVELTTRHEHEQQQRSMNMPYFPQLALSSLPSFPSSLSMETNLSHDATTPINNIKEPVVIVSPAGRSRRRRIPQLQQRKRSFNESQQQQQELSVAPITTFIKAFIQQHNNMSK